MMKILALIIGIPVAIVLVIYLILVYLSWTTNH
jgi:hypothetical protein